MTRRLRKISSDPCIGCTLSSHPPVNVVPNGWSQEQSDAKHALQLLQNQDTAEDQTCSLNQDEKSLVLDHTHALRTKSREMLHKSTSGVKKTPRRIIMEWLLSKSCSIDCSWEDKFDDKSPMAICHRLAHNPKANLDIPLDIHQVEHLRSNFNDLFGDEGIDSVILVTCCVCRKAKFGPADDKSESPFIEFITFPLRNHCTKPVCSECYFSSVCSSLIKLQASWWTRENSELSLGCPCGCAEGSISIPETSDLAVLLKLLGRERPLLMKM